MSSTLRSLLLVPPKLALLTFALVFAIYMSKLVCCATFMASEMGARHPQLASGVWSCVLQ